MHKAMFSWSLYINNAHLSVTYTNTSFPWLHNIPLFFLKTLKNLSRQLSKDDFSTDIKKEYEQVDAVLSLKSKHTTVLYHLNLFSVIQNLFAHMDVGQIYQHTGMQTHGFAKSI